MVTQARAGDVGGNGREITEYLWRAHSVSRLARILNDIRPVGLEEASKLPSTGRQREQRVCGARARKGGQAGMSATACDAVASLGFLIGPHQAGFADVIGCVAFERAEYRGAVNGRCRVVPQYAEKSAFGVDS